MIFFQLCLTICACLRKLYFVNSSIGQQNGWIHSPESFYDFTDISQHRQLCSFVTFWWWKMHLGYFITIYHWNKYTIETPDKQILSQWIGYPNFNGFNQNNKLNGFVCEITSRRKKTIFHARQANIVTTINNFFLTKWKEQEKVLRIAWFGEKIDQKTFWKFYPPPQNF